MTSTAWRSTNLRHTRCSASAPTTSCSSTWRTGAATRPRATRTASSCAPSPRPAWLGRCWRSSGWARRCSPARGRSRAADPLARDVAAAALAGFAYWVVHGSFDWFWEFAGLGAPAFALLGIGLRAPPGARPPRPSAMRRSARRSRSPAARARLLWARRWSGVCARRGVVAAPWLSQLQVRAPRGSGRSAADGLRPPERRRPAEPAQRRSRISWPGASRCATANWRGPMQRILTGAGAQPQRRLRDARAGARSHRATGERARPERARTGRAA